MYTPEHRNMKRAQHGNWGCILGGFDDSPYFLPLSTHHVCRSLSSKLLFALILLFRPEPYDPHLPVNNVSTSWNRPGSTSQGPSRSPRVASVQAQIDDTVEVMRGNIAKVAQRQETLDSLEARTGPCAEFSSCLC